MPESRREVRVAIETGYLSFVRAHGERHLALASRAHWTATKAGRPPPKKTAGDRGPPPLVLVPDRSDDRVRRDQVKLVPLSVLTAVLSRTPIRSISAVANVSSITIDMAMT